MRKETRSAYVAHMALAASASRVATRHHVQRAAATAPNGNQGMLRCLFLAATIGALAAYGFTL